MGFAEEVKAGERFEFGRNWRRFLSTLNDERIDEAVKSLIQVTGRESLDGLTFLDVGSGSGLFSMAARRLGATVHSFDYDPQSVACTRYLRSRYFPDDPRWTIEQGSVLDKDFLARLGQYDVVYAYGVLHHTGDMWTALDNVVPLVKPGAILFIAIYNDCGEISEHWLKIKKKYCSLPRILRFPYALRIWGPIEYSYFCHYRREGNPRAYFDLWRDYKKSRGMSRWHDMVDWLGGYPYEYASAERLIEFYAQRGFSLTSLEPNTGYGNNLLVLTAPGG